MRALALLILAVLWLCMPLSAAMAGQETSADALPTVLLPAMGLGPGDVAVVINEAEPLSRMIGEYYRQRRGIPEANVVRVSFEPGVQRMEPEVFAALRRDILTRTPAQVQAYALAFSAPYAVGCMSVTSAVALGYSPKYCASGCKPTAASSYFGYEGHRPWDDLGVRPAMMLAATDFLAAKALVDRGILADDSWPQGTAYLLSTSDRSRNVRALGYPAVRDKLGMLLPVRIMKADSLRGRDDVLFYFTGLARVPDIYANRYLPGAMADHLTSYGGALDSGRQMTVLEWLQAGATGSYGTVVEPCNLPGKFPDPLRAMSRYLRGMTLLEAYWGSVAMPGQGLFVGEPLAAPFGGCRIERDGAWLRITTRGLPPGKYDVLASADGLPPFRPLRRNVEIWGNPQMFQVQDNGSAYLQVLPSR